MFFAILRMVHIMSGLTALLLGTAAIVTPKKRGSHTSLGEAYFAFIHVIAATAIVMGVLHWQESWYLIPIAAVSYGYAWRGVRAMRMRGPDSLREHIGGMLGSYTAIWTA